MAKTRSQYVCQQCGYSQVGWAGKCPNCSAWGSLVETVISTDSNRRAPHSNSKQTQNTIPQKLLEIKLSKNTRISTHIPELDRVLGGGLVAGQVILLAGEPGIGKSTLLLELVDKISGKTLYASGEESNSQIKIRAERMGIKNKDVMILEENDVDSIISKSGQIDDLKVLVVDSIQTMSTQDLTGMAGSVGQVRECTSRFVKFAKQIGIPVIIVGHVTKEGTVAGPSVLAHIVDTILWFEGDKSLILRMLRAIKNRFGPTDEVGIFEMENKGLVSISDPEKLFVTKGSQNIAGSIIAGSIQGSRPILVEIQSLVVPTKLAFPRRIAQGIDSKRFEFLLAIIQRRCGLSIFDQDAFVNVTGGINIKETGVDLAVCLAIASAILDRPLPVGSVAIGEVDLLGFIREVPQQDKRIKEAKRLGYTMVISNKEVKYLSQAIKMYLR